MYTDFYNLKEKPFNLTPSPRFLYLGETHKEALSLLSYGVVERKGFVLLTGEVGTGKTTIVQALLKNLESSVKYVYLSNPTLSAKDFLFYVASGLGIRTPFNSKGPFLVQFEDFLKKFFQHQRNVLLIVDEAQKLSFELLEEIRLLSNMETADEKLINIFLVGQPEFNEKLSKPICKPLLQRISIRYHIEPLDLGGTQEYITTRLKVAGAENGYKIFPKNVIKAIHLYSKGYPRTINILADNALLLGYSKGRKKITRAMVKTCYQDISIARVLSRKRHQNKETSDVKKTATSHPRSYWKWAAILLMILTVIFAMGTKGQDIVGSIAGLIPTYTQPPFKEASKYTQSKSVVQTERKKDDTIDIMPPKKPKVMEDILLNEDKESWEYVIVKKGDTLSKLAMAVYGQANEDNVKLVHKHNPQIEDINWIQVGQKIIFPPLSLSDQGPPFTVHISSFKTSKTAQALFEKLKKEGFEVYIVPANNSSKGQVFRVTLGNFDSRQEAEDFGATILKKRVSDYAKTIQLEMR